MDDVKADYLIKNNISICTSFDGPEFIHNSQRIPLDKNFNSHANAVSWILRLKKQGVLVGTLPVFTKNHWTITGLLLMST